MPSTAEFADALHRVRAVQFGEFTLKDGSTSPVYCDLRLLISDPSVLRATGACFAEVLSGLEFDRLAAIPYAGLPLGAAAALAAECPLVFPRKEAKGYGAGRSVEGHFEPGERVAVLDDLITSGKSKLEAIAPLEEAGLLVHDVVVLIDRRPAGSTDLEDAGYTLHARFTLEDIAQELASAGNITASERGAIERYLDRP